MCLSLGNIIRLRWSSGYHAALRYPRSRVRSWPKPSDFPGKKFLSMPSFVREVKPFASCRRFAACKRFLNGVKNAPFRQNYRTILAHFHLSVLRALPLMGSWRHLAAKVGTFKGRGKQWQTTPKILPIMQRARAIQVD
jgi:hypothetical protein